ncbi:MAG TPA: hypothetical protein VMI10_13585 [Terriglobales bacterium]|nr:hypothetical protein [Terriglobales bacterium]
MPELETIFETAPVASEWPEPPRLLIEWSSPWQEFKTAWRPALSRAPVALAGEAPVGIFPYRGMLVSWALECLLLIAVIVLPARIASLQPFVPPPKPKWDVIYFSGDELPQTADRGGSQAGKSGRAGGQQAHHRTQTIKVARGDKPGETVVDAPKVNLPRSDSAVANLLAFKPIPGPPPAEGMQARMIAPVLPKVAPIPPAPQVGAASRSQTLLTASAVAPAPEVAHDTRRNAAMNATVIAPAPNPAADKLRASATISSTVVAPTPTTPRDLAASRAPISQATDVVAPPVSAPMRELSSTSRLSLPTQTVVAPPPSATHEINSWGSARTGDLRSQPVPPPPSAGGVSAQGRGRSGGGTLTSDVVPPPASISGTGSSGGGSSGGQARAGRGGTGQLDTSAIVPPPPTIGGSVGGGKSETGNGRGNKGQGTGGPLDLGSSVAPPGNNGNAAVSGIVVSSQPGSKVGVPNGAGGGAIAMSPEGTAKSGLGGSGGGTGIGRGNGPGSGLSGGGTGAAKAGVGRGSDANARGGISPYPGSGGAGSGTSGSPAVPGVSVEGGTTSVTLPSFGPPGGDAPSTGPGRSSTASHRGFEATVEAGSRSGGVFGTGYYGFLKGKNYSIYIETSIGTAVMQYSDPASAAHPTGESLSAPEPMRKELPAGLRPTRVILACTLDRSGVLKNVRVLEPGATETTSKILVALPGWKFRPAFRGNEAVEVTAILGFGVDTR